MTRFIRFIRSFIHSFIRRVDERRKTRAHLKTRALCMFYVRARTL